MTQNIPLGLKMYKVNSQINFIDDMPSICVICKKPLSIMYRQPNCIFFCGCPFDSMSIMRFDN